MPMGGLLISCRIISVIAAVLGNSCSSGSCSCIDRSLMDGDGDVVGRGTPGKSPCELWGVPVTL